MDVIFQDFVYNENNGLIENEHGQILCNIRDFEGKKDTVLIARDTLIECNILPREETQDQSDVLPESPTNTKTRESPQVREEKELNEWSDNETQLILDKYAEYIDEVGPMKKFRTKKKMWEYMTKEINTEFKMNRTPQQFENRFKTVLKRKKKAVSNNNRSGSQRSKIEFEEELNKIANKDDSIEPEIMKDQNEVIITSKNYVTGQKRKSFALSEVYQTVQGKKMKQHEQLHKEKEENKERRHREKLQLLKELFNKE